MRRAGERGASDAGPLFAPRPDVPVASVLTQTPSREVQCYHCRRTIFVPVKAVTLTCPLCYKPIEVNDVFVNREQIRGAVRTCGVVVVGARGKLHAGSVVASLGVQVLGELVGDVATHGPVVIGPKAVWDGDCIAANIVIQPGATIRGGRFTIRNERTHPSHA